jgi:hypothetical protein
LTSGASPELPAKKLTPVPFFKADFAISFLFVFPFHVLFTEKSPFENPPRIPEKILWVEPKLVCEISFAEWTQDGELRQTVFLGWRDDKKPKDVVLER